MIIVEQLIFNILAFALFVVIFLKIIIRNDASYVISLLIEALGIAINFIEIVKNESLPIFLKVIVYVLGILLPILIIGAVLLFGDCLIDFIDCNEELTLIFIVILLMLLFL